MRSWEGGDKRPPDSGGPVYHIEDRGRPITISEHLSPTLSPARLALQPLPDWVGPGPPSFRQTGRFHDPPRDEAR